MKPRDHWDKLGQMGCCVCGHRPAQLHHASGGSLLTLGIHKAKGRKNSDFLALPICHRHHLGRAGIHSLGVQTWERMWGYQTSHLARLGSMLGLDLISLAKGEKPARRAYRRSSKTMPREW